MANMNNDQRQGENGRDEAAIKAAKRRNSFISGR